MSEQPSIRAHMRERLIKAGIPSAVASEMADLAAHAADEATAAIVRVTGAASDPIIKLNAMMIAGQILSAKFELIQQKATHMADEAGLSHFTLKAEPGA